MLRFKWKEDRNTFSRCTRMVMHHTHELDNKERSNISKNLIQLAIQTYEECKAADFTYDFVLIYKFLKFYVLL